MHVVSPRFSSTPFSVHRNWLYGGLNRWLSLDWRATACGSRHGLSPLGNYLQHHLAKQSAFASGPSSFNRGAYLSILFSQRFRFWFATLSRPKASDDLKKALAEWKARPQSTRLICRLGLAYERAGLRRAAGKQLTKLPQNQSLYHPFLKAVLAYRRREYKKAGAAFLFTSDFPPVDGYLKASLLAASACSAFADGDVLGALHLSERALEFDDACLVARMVKVDVFLRQGKKEQAGQEILSAMHRGLSLDLESKIPLDVDRTFEMLCRLEESSASKAYQAIA